MTLVDLPTVLVIFSILLLPGWAFLGVTGFWKRWAPLQRWILAICISIAFYPIFYYFTRLIIPQLRLGTSKLTAILVIFALLILFTLRKEWKDQFSFDSLELTAIFVFAATLFTRFWVASQYPYPAWTDSLHHTLLTNLTAAQGKLPSTLEPYAPTVLDMYHLGLYAITAVVQHMGQVPPHTALQWTAQTLNGLCGIGLFFVLDRKVGRQGALVGAVVAGLLSFQPAWYVNWGRFTQVASQTILLVTWIVCWEAVSLWRTKSYESRLQAGIYLGCAALLNAGMYLTHFRVAIYYLPLLLISLLWEAFHSWRGKQFSQLVFGTTAVGSLSLVFTLPALVSSLNKYIQSRLTIEPAAAVTETVRLAVDRYYQFDFAQTFALGIQKWLVIVGLISLIVCLRYRSRFGAGVLLWMVFLWLQGNAYLLGIPLLNFTNFSGIIILLYLPIALLIGTAAQLLFQQLPLFQFRGVQTFSLGILLLAGFISGSYRMHNVELPRYFMTPADFQAMEWINASIPDEAIFAINTDFWFPNVPHGADGGYWIPYFTGNRTTTSTMLIDLGPKDYSSQVVEWSQAEEEFARQPNVQTAGQLCALGVDYVYIGVNGFFNNPSLEASAIQQVPGTVLLYQQQGVSIFKLCSD